MFWSYWGWEFFYLSIMNKIFFFLKKKHKSLLILEKLVRFGERRLVSIPLPLLWAGQTFRFPFLSVPEFSSGWREGWHLCSQDHCTFYPLPEGWVSQEVFSPPALSTLGLDHVPSRRDLAFWLKVFVAITRSERIFGSFEQRGNWYDGSSGSLTQCKLSWQLVHHSPPPFFHMRHVPPSSVKCFLEKSLFFFYSEILILSSRCWTVFLKFFGKNLQ